MGDEHRSAPWDAGQRTLDANELAGRPDRPNAKSLDEREAAVASGEGAVLTREESAGLREEAAQLREELATIREQSLRGEEEAAKAKAELEGLASVQLREANEHLVVAAVQAQTMTEAAEHSALQMAYAAQHDFLTNSPTDRLEQ